MEEPFDIAEIPHDLKSLFLEKLRWKEYAVFSQCSVFSRDLCGQYPNLKFDYEMPVVNIREHIEACLTPFGNEVPLHRADFYRARIVCKRLMIRRALDHTCAQVIRRFGVRTENLIVLGEPEPNYMNELLSILNPQKLECTSSSKILDSDKVQKVPILNIEIIEGLPSDYQVLQLQGTRIKLTNCSDLSQNCIVQLTKEWAFGKRQINHIVLAGSQISMKNLATALGARLNGKKTETQFIFLTSVLFEKSLEIAKMGDTISLLCK